MEDEDERKATILRDRDGDWNGLAISLGIVLIFVILIGLITGISAISDYYEVQAFNRIHGTDYTFGEWFWAEGTIKEYHLGTVENQNYQVDLNIKNLPIELEGGKE